MDQAVADQLPVPSASVVFARGWYDYFGDFIYMRTTKEIFKEILVSAETNCVLKIKLRKQKNPVITAVEKVLKNQIILKPTCLYGYEIKTRTIALTDIETVTRYKTSFDNPLFAKLRFIRNNIGAIRKDFTAISQQGGIVPPLTHR